MYVPTGIGQLGQPVLPLEGEARPRFPSPAGGLRVVAIFGLTLTVAYWLFGKHR